MHEITGYLKLD